MTTFKTADFYRKNTSDPLRVLSLCTGMGGDAAAFLRADIAHELVAVAEFDPLASAVLAQKFPDVPNLGDINAITNWKDYHGKIELIIAGIPCQPYSSAGKQRGASDRRDLSIAVAKIIREVRPRFLVIENVPQFETVQGGRPFRRFITSIRDAGYALGHRVIDASNFVAQRRKRLFICGYRGTASCSPAQILAFAAGGERCAHAGGAASLSFAAGAAGGSFVLHPPRLGTMMASGSGMNRPGLKGHEMDFLIVQDFPGHGLVVRRPTPLEALRAQGFPDNWLDEVRHRGKPLTDSQKYRLIGNSWPVPVAAAILSEVNRHWVMAA